MKIQSTEDVIINQMKHSLLVCLDPLQGSWPESKTGSEVGCTIESKVNCALYTPKLANEIAFTAFFDLPTSNFRIETEKVYLCYFLNARTYLLLIVTVC